MSTKPKRHRCKSDGCRRLASEGKELCSKCVAEPDAGVPANTAVDPDPSDGRQMSERDTLRFARYDAEMRNHLIGIRMTELESIILREQMVQKLNEVRRQFEEKLEAKQAHIKQLNADKDALRPVYDKLLSELAARYDIEDVRRMLVDTDTGTIRESPAFE